MTTRLGEKYINRMIKMTAYLMVECNFAIVILFSISNVACLLVNVLVSVLVRPFFTELLR